jgi:hypothetical protein
VLVAAPGRFPETVSGRASTLKLSGALRHTRSGVKSSVGSAKAVDATAPTIAMANGIRIFLMVTFPS